MSDILTRLEQGVMTLTLNRPAKKNALTKAMYDDLTAGLIQAGRDDAVHVVIIAAEGPDFCSGNDIGDFAQDLPILLDPETRLEDMPVYRFLKALIFFEKPLIAAIQGQAAGVGVTLLLHCDLVVAADDIRLSLPFLKLGLVPEAGSTLLLPQRIGHARAFAWMALGEVIGAEEALRLGLLNAVVAREHVENRARSLADPLLALSASALRHTKRLMRDPNALWQVVGDEGVIFREQLTSPQTQAAFMAFLSR
ncbi:MAG: enoyl-CoA hydratase-related protein [Asticcacaulis sp.]